jgi:ABC-type sugar transport system ATPase subunit
VLQLLAIEKNFGGVRALRGASLEARQGEIMGLCGENGAGKSTLMKILGGVYPFDSYSGGVVVGGELQRLTGPADARRAGIAVVHQEPTLVPELTVAQNLLLGREPRRFGLVDDARLEVMARSDVARFGFAEQIDVTKPIQRLGVGLQQMVEIMRALRENARILVLDEPTAALTGREAELLMGWLKSLRSRGTTCVYVSHRLDEVFALCDRVTVLRDGRTAATLVTAETTPDQVVSEMVGRAVHGRSRPKETAPSCSTPVLEVKDLYVNRVKPTRRSAGGEGVVRPFAVAGATFSVRPGEILAICGAMGSGRTALLSALFGCARAGTSGQVRVGGVCVDLDSPLTAIRHGIAFVPEDRRAKGLVPNMTLGENLALPSLSSREVMGNHARVGLVDPVAEELLADRRIRSLRIRGEASVPVSTLSGGNQQKAVFGKWLEHPPKVLLLDEPTRGVDVGAREEIYRILEDLTHAGVAIVFASSDLSEVLRLALRVIVLRDGRPVGELEGSSATEEAIVLFSTGAAGSNPASLA